LPVVNDTAQAVLADLMGPNRRRVHFLNAHCVNVMARVRDYRRALATADAVLPDGAGIELALRLRGERLAENLNGTDFVPRLAQAAASAGQSVFLLGARPGTAEAAAAELQRRAPGLRIAGTLDGFAGAADSEAAIARINDSGADILLVALGVPETGHLACPNAPTGSRLAAEPGRRCLFRLSGAATCRARLPWPCAAHGWNGSGGWRKNRAGWPGAIWSATPASRPAPSRTRCGISMRSRQASACWISQSPAGAAVALAPLLLVAALAVKATSRGPVFFRQTRIGKNGRPFKVLKFRSMYSDAEARRHALLAQSSRAGVCFKAKNDPRITPFGRVMRRFSIDELPQVFNVLRGEMAIVGPRPALPSEVAAYPSRALGRLKVKPGITGVWQVAGRAEIGFDKMIDMDLAYTRSRSLLLDLMLIALTFRAVLSGRGAY
jgi:lipopolysaccharide/colanic/teichoic acid biosynthesis glycosyltransferase